MHYGKFYIGQTNDIDKRLRAHNHGNVRSTKAYQPYRVIHAEAFESRTEAIKREHFLKSPKGWREPSTIKTKGRGFPEGIP